MDIPSISMSDLIPKLDEKRISLGLSYQNVADACNGSQRTIIRFFRQDNKAAPSVELLQNVIAAVEYDFVQAPIAPAQAAPEAYNQYLVDYIKFEREDKRIRLAQQEARHNRRHREHMRIILFLAAVILTFTFFICGILVYDLTHIDRGWFQQMYGQADNLSNVIMSAWGYLTGR